MDAEGEYGAISMATDIYAIGATLYFAVTGHAPEKSLDKVTPLEQYKPKISRSMQTIITRAMQKQQEKRFQQAAEMLRALKNIDKMDRNYKDYQVRKRVIALALAVCFSASAYSCYYGVTRMRSEREISICWTSHRRNRLRKPRTMGQRRPFCRVLSNGSRDGQMPIYSWLC